MKKIYIEYKNLGKNLNGGFQIISNKGDIFETNSNDLQNGLNIYIKNNSDKIHIIPKSYDFLISGDSNPQMSGLKLYKTTGTFNSNPVYYDTTDTYALWKVQTLNSWYITAKNRVGSFTTSPSSGFSGLGASSITGSYTGTNWSGSFSLTKIENYLRIYNTPGVTGFAGIYASGVYTISGISRAGFRNTQNSNFYIYKNNSPSEWRAVQTLSTGNSFTWYKNLDTNYFVPMATGWILGDSVSGKYAPTPETNFGTCKGNTILLPNYIFELNSFDANIDKIKFYSGGVINNDGTSDVFPQGIKVKDLFPNIQKNILLNKFYYTEYKNQNRYFLFRTAHNWLITDLLGNYNNPGYYYWESNKNSYFYDSGNTNLNSATGSYFVNGNNTSGLENIFININPYFLDKDIFEYDQINFNNYSGLIWLSQDSREEIIATLKFIETGNNKLINYFNNTDLKTIQFSGFYGENISGNFYSGSGSNFYTKIENNTPIKLSIYSQNTGHLIEWLSSPYTDGPYTKFNLYSGNYLTGKIITKNTTSQYILTGYLPYGNQYLILSGSGIKNYSSPLNIFITGNLGYYSGIFTNKKISIHNSDFDGFYTCDTNTQSGQYSGLKCIIGDNYILATPEFQITGAKSLSSGTSIWSILDSNFNYTQWKNFESDPSKIPFQYWMSGSGMSENILDLKYIPLHYYNNYLYPTYKLLNIDTGYNYNQISGLSGLQSGQTFVFNFFNDTPLTGTVLINTGYIYGTLNLNTLESKTNSFIAKFSGNNVNLSISNYNKNIEYRIYKTGNNTILYKKYIDI